MTLSELLVSCALIGLVLGASFMLLESGERAYAVGTARVESQQSARVALFRLATELREAGWSAGETAFPALSVAEPNQLTLHKDLDGDGAIERRRETVIWRLDGRGILRRDAGGGAQPVINGVRVFELRYFDAAGVPTTVVDEVRSIEITLATRADHAASRTGSGQGATVATHVRLRNR